MAIPYQAVARWRSSLTRCPQASTTFVPDSVLQVLWKRVDSADPFNIRFRHMTAIPSQVRLSPLPLLRFYFASIMGGAFDSETFRTNPNLKRAYPHAIPPSLHLGAPQPNATTILVTVSGTLLLYDATEGLPAQATSSRGPPGQQRQRREGKSQNEDPDTLPRLFSHTFILVPQQGPQGQVTYAIEGETFRYVG